MSGQLPKPTTPLGLPPGSIRGLLAVQITTIFLLLLLVPEANQVPVPLNLYFLLSLVMVFFVAHGASIREKSDPSPSPLYLPGGTLRFLMLGGTIGALVYLGMNHPERFDRLTPDPGQFANWKFYLGSLAGGFFVGHLLKISPLPHGWAFQSFQAWVALIAMLSLVVETILQVFAKPSLVEKLDFVTWQCLVTGITAFYYGVRS
ncbi:hypothetical protein [Zavarzinella formosa]|uniref:hypothetical protein n=1 Tax=Zavarzinella formosa TaxID=360055 RepID=UPI0002FB7E75|nr:hypothetical protein [Zavarzinella formosa]